MQLIEAIIAVVHQTSTRWELIIWDDGSTDETGEIVKAYQDNRIQYYSDENHGAAYARNRALEKSNSRYIAFLDSDDQWFPQKLSTQLAAMEENPDIDLLFSNFENINLNKQSHEIAFEEYSSVLSKLEVEARQSGIKVIQKHLLENLALCNFIATDTVMMKREIIDRYGGFNENLRNSEDFELWWRLALAGVRFAYTDEVLMTRYKPPDSLSSPGLLTAQNTIKALDLCVSHAISAGRADLVPHLNAKYRNAWQHMIIAHGRSGEKTKAVDAFLRSIKYGFRPGSLYLVLKAISQHNK